MLNTMASVGEIVEAPSIPDHKAVIIIIGSMKDRGKGYWKLNTSILSDDCYKNDIIQIIDITTAELATLNQPVLVWDIIKIRIKEATIRFCSMKQKSNNKEIKHLEEQILELITRIIMGSKTQQAELLRAKSRLKEAYDIAYYKKAKAAQIRSRAQYVEEGEKSTKYFLSLEQRNQINNSIYSLELDSGRIVTDTDSIIAETTKFYEQMYTSKEIPQEDITNYLTNMPVTNTLSNDDLMKCEGDITEEECYEALKQMNIGKSPGDDGLPVEFYRTFWDHIKKPLIACYKCSFEQGLLSQSQTRAVITLIHKKGSKKLLKNYRPISLTNVDYKILAFLLSNRLHKVINKLVGPQQTAYIKGRFIGENIRSVLDILEYTDKKNIPGILLCLDFQKAFDHLEWNFMINTLKRFNFGKSFIKWIEILYSKQLAKLKVNEWISKPIQLSRGIRQGCPISAMLFILCTEIMAISILSNEEIKGIKIPTENSNILTQQKMSQYADDTSLVLKDENQIIPALDTIAKFSSVSGLTLNLEKTEALWLGSLKNRKDKPFGFQWPKTIRYLGIYIGYDTQETQRWNWTNKLELFQKTLDCWRTRDLTIFGRMIIVKTLALSKLTYSATMLPLPKDICTHLEG